MRIHHLIHLKCITFILCSVTFVALNIGCRRTDLRTATYPVPVGLSASQLHDLHQDLLQMDRQGNSVRIESQGDHLYITYDSMRLARKNIEVVLARHTPSPAPFTPQE